MSIVSAVSRAWDVLKSGVVPIKRQFGYVMSSKSYDRDLQKEVENLRDTTGRVRNTLEVARNNLRDISRNVTDWLASAEQALKEAEDLLGKFKEASKSCRRGTLPDLNCRYQFSRNAEDKIRLIHQQRDRLPPECSDISFGVGAPTSSLRMDCGLRTVSTLLWWAVTEINRHSGYVISSESYAQDLRKEVGKLAYKVDWVDLAMKEASKNRANVYSLVLDWHKSAAGALKEARDLLDDFKKARKTWCCGNLPRYEFSTKAKDKIEGIQKLTQGISKYKKSDDICSSARPGYVSSTSKPVELRDDGVFESRASVILKIMDALADNSNSAVGVYGMGGVGKSYLLLDVERRIRQEKSFDWIAKADVSENPDIKKIQKEIARWLGLSDLDKEEDVSVRAERLRERLEKEEREKKKVLIILDNLWERLDLKSVGIPCEPYNKARGCKLLLTSRDQHVLQYEMGYDEAFPLGGLQEEEAKRLIEKTVGSKVREDVLRSTVKVALDSCAGMPFLIVAMAKRLKYANCDNWKETLQQIKKSKHEEFNELTNRMLRRSYNQLGEEEKSFLQLCVVYGGSEPSLENLMKYGVSLGIFRGGSNVEEDRDKWRSLIRSLQDASLLLDSEEADRFKIHDIVRNFVVLFASRDHRLHVLNDKDKSGNRAP